MSHICWMLEMDVQEGQENNFRTLIAEMVRATRANESGTLDYEWSISPDGKRCHSFERYVDDAAVLTHLGTFGDKFASHFLETFTPVKLVVYGSPSDAVRSALAGFNPVYMQPVEGFSR